MSDNIDCNVTANGGWGGEYHIVAILSGWCRSEPNYYKFGLLATLPAKRSLVTLFKLYPIMKNGILGYYINKLKTMEKNCRR